MSHQVVTLTLNPCLDLGYEFDSLNPRDKTTATATRLEAAGKGINVARAIQRLGISVIPVTIAGGLTGQLHSQLLRLEFPQAIILPVDSETRINAKLVGNQEPRAQYEIDGVPPTLTATELQRVRDALLDACTGPWAVLSGTTPRGVPHTFYQSLVSELRQHGARVALDAKEDALHAALEAHPTFIKPNEFELETLVGHPLPDLGSIAAATRVLQRRGVEFACVSLGSRGALLATEAITWHASAPPIEPRSSVGAGDATVAGFVSGSLRGLPPQECLRFAVACGSGTAAQPGTQAFDPATLDSLLAQISLTQLD